jgi:hypothetical protein
VIVAELVPLQVTRACPVESVTVDDSDSVPLDVVSPTVTCAAGVLPTVFADVRTMTSSTPPPAGMSQESGVRKTAAAVGGGGGGPGCGVGAAGDLPVQAVANAAHNMQAKRHDLDPMMRAFYTAQPRD